MVLDTVFPNLLNIFPEEVRHLFDQLVEHFDKSSECYVVEIIQKIANAKKYSTDWVIHLGFCVISLCAICKISYMVR